ncbi:MAG: GIY-YIG nuclease family protein, partial [Bacteroidales bacterium]|nr:GIY-YIG nuclease family protein [Bacteroidales bacterium]
YIYDSETDFYLTNTRYYDPGIGKFLNADSHIAGVGGNIKGYNLFAYCFNNPVNMSDTTGKWPSWSQVCFAVTVTALTVAAAAAVVATAGAAAPALALAGGGIISASAAATATSVATAALVTAGVAMAATIVTDAVENSNYQGPIRDQSVYVMRDKTTNEVQYVGRTNNPGRRQSEHAKDPKKANLQPLEVKFSGLTKHEARAIEQMLISAYSLDNLSNARREISVGNVGGFAGKIGKIINLFGSVAEDELLNLMGR